MKLIQAMRLAVLLVACQFLDTGNHVVAEEDGRPTTIFNPHHLIELGPFIRLPSVRKELQVTDQQIGDVEFIERLSKDRFEQYKEQVSRPEWSDEHRALYLGFQADQSLFRAQSDAVFRPDQLNRLKQLASQHVTRGPVESFGLLTPSIKKELGITGQQAKTLYEKSAVMADQLQRRE